jgi:hypothetical protein
LIVVDVLAISEWTSQGVASTRRVEDDENCTCFDAQSRARNGDVVDYLDAAAGAVRCSFSCCSPRMFLVVCHVGL